MISFSAGWYSKIVCNEYNFTSQILEKPIQKDTYFISNVDNKKLPDQFNVNNIQLDYFRDKVFFKSGNDNYQINVDRKKSTGNVEKISDS